MKKFRIIFTDSKIGMDLYNKVVVVEAETMSAVARRLENFQATFRLIEEVTDQYAAHFFCHALCGDYVPESSKV